jgi:hypothetical protein
MNYTNHALAFFKQNWAQAEKTCLLCTLIVYVQVAQASLLAEFSICERGRSRFVSCLEADLGVNNSEQTLINWAMAFVQLKLDLADQQA